jgi:hypothetical protein
MDDLTQYVVSHEVSYRVRSNQIDLLAQQFLEIELEANEFKKAHRLFELHKDVHIAVWTFLATGH